jgi:hypothetical protein
MARKQAIPTAHGEAVVAEQPTETKEVEQPTESTDTNATEDAPVKPKPKKEVRIVTLDDGTQVNFGARANLLSSIDLESSTIIFKIVTGKVINWVITEMDNLTPFQKTVFMYGLLEKVKTSLAPVKLAKLEEAIAKQIAAVTKGDFNIRSINTVGEVALSDLQKAYALAFSKQYPDKAKWADIDDVATIAEVLEVWENKTPVQRNAIRRHPSVAWELNVMAIATGDAEDLSDM